MTERQGEYLPPNQVSPADNAPQIPPHPLDNLWHMYVNGQTYGPFSGRKMQEFTQEGRLQPQTEVCRVGGEYWLAASVDPILGALFAPSSPPVTRQTEPSHVTAARGATVVQVTNHIAPPAPPTVVFEDGTRQTQIGGDGAGAVPPDSRGRPDV